MEMGDWGCDVAAQSDAAEHAGGDGYAVDDRAHVDAPLMGHRTNFEERQRMEMFVWL